MTDKLDVFYFDGDTDNFESISVENGTKTWSARILMEKLGYDNFPQFKKAIDRGIQACIALNIPHEENFIYVERTEGGNTIKDYKLTRFACYLTSMNADPKKTEVAKAQAYFITYAEGMRLLLEKGDSIDRVILRTEITDREKSLNGVIQRAGVEHYPLFKNAGYRGMYNMNINSLKALRKLGTKDSLLDFMGKTELAANLFRITQTQEKIKNEGIQGQKALEYTAEKVGKEIRNTIIRISGTKPEFLPVEDSIKNVGRKIKTTAKEFTKIDKKKK